MKIELEPGRYVVAVSGGVDSVVLLDLLAPIVHHPTSDVQLVVAHYDHGIRVDSAKDREFVGELAKKCGLEFYYEEGKLGANASEALAREKRYEFLEKIRQKTKSDAIITAHHQDDLLETALINLMRGTGRLGLSSLESTEKVKRPLLGFSKADIRKYAADHELAWREDPTNADDTYLRNYVRHELLPKLNREKLLEITRSSAATNAEIDDIVGSLLSAKLDRQMFIMLPYSVSLEIMAAWLRSHGISGYDRRMLDRLVVAAKTARLDSRHNISGSYWLTVGGKELALTTSDC